MSTLAAAPRDNRAPGFWDSTPVSYTHLSCGFMINGVAHGPRAATTVCQLTMRHFKEGQELVIEPWRAAAFPLIKDLIVDRRSFDRIIASGGYISVSTGNATDGNTHLIGKEIADRAMDAAACIGCGACVAACPNASSALFTGAKIAHLGILPQGKPERDLRALRMVAQMNTEAFGKFDEVLDRLGRFFFKEAAHDSAFAGVESGVSSRFTGHEHS